MTKYKIDGPFYYFTSMIPDITIPTTTDILVEISITLPDGSGNRLTILKEMYSPDNSGIVCLNGQSLGNTISSYLYGNTKLDIGYQSNIFQECVIYVNTNMYSILDLLLCYEYTDIPCIDYFNSYLFLNCGILNRYTLVDGLEYLSIFGDESMSQLLVSVCYLKDNKIVNSEQRVLQYFTDKGQNPYTIDCSFGQISKCFYDILPDTIISYQVYSNGQVARYVVERTPCVQPIQFLWRNKFGVPETLWFKGTIVRKHSQSFDAVKINNLSSRANIIRSDVLTFTSETLYSPDQYILYRDMLDSNEIYINYQGFFTPVTVNEDSNELALRNNSLQSVVFSVLFADVRQNSIIHKSDYSQWILLSNKWNDSGKWMDSGNWDDK